VPIVEALIVCLRAPVSQRVTMATTEEPLPRVARVPYEKAVSNRHSMYRARFLAACLQMRFIKD
jgi:hypothetical protein